jgi:hypothetical protein
MWVCQKKKGITTSVKGRVGEGTWLATAIALRRVLSKKFVIS